MVLEQTRPFRLVERGGAGLACDADGISLGGTPLASVDPGGAGLRRYIVRTADEVGAILRAAYGPQRPDVVERCHRGLRRAAAALEAQDLALAGIETVMLALPELDADAMAKLSRLADLEKGGDSWEDQPRVAHGQTGGGQWTTGGGGAAPPIRKPKRAAPIRAIPARRTRPATTHSAGNTATRSRRAGYGAATPETRARLAGPRSGQPTAMPPKPQAAGRSGEAPPDLVDASNAVAGSLVDFAHWLGEPQTYVPIAPEIAAGEPGFPMGPALEETTDPNALRDWRPVSHLEAAADVLSVVGELAPAARIVVGEARALAGEARAGSEVMRFSSAAKLKRYPGSPGRGNEWHHVVEQTPKNLKRFGARAIHSTDTVVSCTAPVWNQDAQEIRTHAMIDPEKQFIESARKHGRFTVEGDSRATNAAYDRVVSARKILNTYPDKGQKFLSSLLCNSDLSIVSWAAFYLLPFRKAEAVKALERVARSDAGLIGFCAETTLEEFRAGRLTVD